MEMASWWLGTVGIQISVVLVQIFVFEFIKELEKQNHVDNVTSKFASPKISFNMRAFKPNHILPLNAYKADFHEYIQYDTGCIVGSLHQL